MSDKEKVPQELWRVVAERNTVQGVILHVKHYHSIGSVNTYVRWIQDEHAKRGSILSVTKYVQVTQ